jgi:alanine dehydrogenase
LRIGVPRELAPGESRVALAPHAVYELTRAGHRVLVGAGAGEASSIADEQYEEAGAVVVGEAGRVYEESELLVKVYGPVEEEYDLLREGLILFSFLSLPVNPSLMQALLDSRCVAVAVETIRDARGRLPVLAPMSEIAGRLTPQIGAHYLQHQSGGRGILLGGSVGVRPGRVVILGCGIVGSAAARVSSGLGARVVVVDRDLDRLRHLEELGLRGVATLAASTMAIRDAALEADLLIGAILVVGARTPALVDRATVEGMKEGSVIVDVDVDQGGCVETSHPTTLEDPTFVEAGVVHYCVKNVPAAVPITATRALSNALLPYVREVAGRGLADAVNSDPGLGRGVAVAEGRVVDPVLARAAGTEHNTLSSVLPLHSEAR